MKKRKKTRLVEFSSIKIGDNNPIIIQSMTNTKTSDAQATIQQIKELEAEGCQLVRVSVPDMESADAIPKIKQASKVPLVADIHFDYRLAIRSIENGVDALRINPGNIGSEDRIKKVVEEAKKHNVAIRIGVNLGSLEKNIQKKYGRTAEAMVESALYNIELLEKNEFYNTVVSLKASDIKTMITAYESFSRISAYPLHLGVTEAGTVKSGAVKSAMGIGYLLLNGIGDTIRVSLTANPVEEISVAKMILNNAGYRTGGVEVIACPTCARTDIDIISLANKVEEATKGIDKNIKVAVMGCVVNGPGEAKDADIGIAGGKKEALFFKKGEKTRKIPKEDIIQELLREIEAL